MMAATAAPSAEALALAQLLAARLTHDLGSPLGTLAGMLDMLEGGDAEMLAVARQAAVDLRQRLRLQAVAWGMGAEPCTADGLRALLAGSAAAQRVAFELSGPLFQAALSAPLVPLVLNAALLAAEALPRGGVVRLAGTARAVELQPEGRNAAWPAEIQAALAGQPAAALAAGPRRLVAPLLLALAAEQNFTCALLPGAGLPLLRLAPA